MAITTTTSEGLNALLQRLGLDEPVPVVAGTDVLAKPVDIWLAYLVDLLVRLLGCEPAQAFDAITHVPPVATEMGDLDIVIPRLKIPGAQMKSVAADFINGVGQPLQCS
jgi:hypothetical protein